MSDKLDLSELRRLAESADMPDAGERLYELLSPTAICSLLDRLAAAETACSKPVDYHPLPSEIHAMARELFNAHPGVLDWDHVIREHETERVHKSLPGHDVEPDDTMLAMLRDEALRALQLGARLPGSEIVADARDATIAELRTVLTEALPYVAIEAMPLTEFDARFPGQSRAEAVSGYMAGPWHTAARDLLARIDLARGKDGAR